MPDVRRLNIMKPQRLYHYTTLSSFNEILKSEELHASSVLFLNDSSEFTTAREATLEALEDRARKGDAPLRPYYDAFRSVLAHYLPASSLFVASLSAARDDLSQWRAYGGDGRGLALGFMRVHLSRQLQAEGHLLAECVYHQDDLTRRALTFVNQQARDLAASGLGATRASLDFLEAFQRFAPRFKNGAFAAEAEWRIILAPPKEAGTVQFKAAGSYLRPYRALPFPRTSFFTVLLGPTATPELVRLSVEARLQASRYPFVPELSSIPYRTSGV